MLQTAAVQDGGTSRATSRYTRLFAWDASGFHPSNMLKGEWVVPLPLNSKGESLACSEIHFIGNNTFLALPRDGGGRGGDGLTSNYK